MHADKYLLLRQLVKVNWVGSLRSTMSHEGKKKYLDVFDSKLISCYVAL